MTQTPKVPRRAALAGVAGIITVVFAVPALSWLGQSPASTGRDGSALGGGLTLFAPKERQQLPDITGTTLAGKPMALTSFAGRVLVINIWGSWCAPCRDEAPDLARVSEATRDSGVRFVGIDTKDNAPAARAFTRRFEIGYPSLFDPDGKVLLELSGIVPVSAIPSTVIVDPDGGVAARVIGRIDGKTLRGLIADVLAEPGPPPALPSGHGTGT